MSVLQLQFFPPPTSRAHQQQREDQSQSPTNRSSHKNNNISSGEGGREEERIFLRGPNYSIAGGDQQQQQQSVPFVTIPGGTKRKRSETDSIPEMSSSGGQQPRQHYFATTSSQFPPTSDVFAGPRQKQQRYEERMSSGLDGIHISRDSRQQPTAPSSAFFPISQQQSRPLIEEIVDWDNELLDDADQQAASASIVEEPATTTKMEREKPGWKSGKKPATDIWKMAIEELNPSSKNSNNHRLRMEEEGEEDEEAKEVDDGHKIVLSEQLRQLVNRGNSTSLLARSQIITGKELIPYVLPSPLIPQPSAPIIGPQIEEIKEEAPLDEEVLPDATTSSPQIDECSVESSPPTPPSAEATLLEDDLPQERGTLAKEDEMDEEEEAMDMD